MGDWPILSLTIFLPIVGALFILAVRGSDEVVQRNARAVALWTSLITFVVSLLIWVNFEPGRADFQMVEERVWFPQLDIAYRVGVDGISLFLILLSTFLTPLCVLASWKSIKYRVREYMIAFLVLETMMVGMFAALDLVLFYVFFEGVLIPMFLIIGIWGGPRRIYATFKFFLYTLLGSVLMLIALLTMIVQAGTTSIPELLTHGFPVGLQYWMWLAFLAAFAVKVPMWPVHTWLPDAHVEAPTAGSVILAGVLLKMGGYGLIRFNLGMLPVASDVLAPLIFALSVIMIVYTSLVALAQHDMKKLIAYSSIAHMGFVTAGVFTATQQGLTGGIYQMLSHGIVSAALFLVVGVIYDRLKTREIDRYGGLVNNMPKYAVVFMVFMLASAGLPGTSGFVGEFLVIVSAFQIDTWLALGVALGMVLGAAYMLWLYRRVVFGKLTKEDVKKMTDLSPREVVVFAPLVVLVIIMGVYPMPFLEAMEASVANLVADYEAAVAAYEAGGTSAVAAR